MSESNVFCWLSSSIAMKGWQTTDSLSCVSNIGFWCFLHTGITPTKLWGGKSSKWGIIKGDLISAIGSRVWLSFSSSRSFSLMKHILNLTEASTSKNVVRYAPLKSSDPNGGRPEHFVVEKPTFSSKLMVFCGIRRDGTFGFKVYKNGESMDTNRYHSLLQHHVMPELRIWNGGNLDGWVFSCG